jgi:GT2 family glycosyltransferase
MPKIEQICFKEVNVKGKHNKISVSIGVVLYYSDTTIVQNLLDSIVKSNNLEKIDLSIYLIDNSVDAKYSSLVKANISNAYDLDIFFIESIQNGGYGAGHNLVMKFIVGKYHVIMNPDVILEEDSLYVLISLLEGRNEIGLASPKIFMKNGEVFKGCKNNPTLLSMVIRSSVFLTKIKLFNNIMKCKTFTQQKTSANINNVEYLSGAMMFFRSDVFLQINGFDESFFLHYEDADITRRALEVSQNIYCKDSCITHLWQGNTHKDFKSWLITANSGIKYLWKWNQG